MKFEDMINLVLEAAQGTDPFIAVLFMASAALILYLTINKLFGTKKVKTTETSKSNYSDPSVVVSRKTTNSRRKSNSSAASSESSSHFSDSGFTTNAAFATGYMGSQVESDIYDSTHDSADSSYCSGSDGGGGGDGGGGDGGGGGD